MKNFFDCKDEKITEKAFSQSLIISVVSILLCLVALCSMTYAWFTGSTSSGNNTLVSGSFDVRVSVKAQDDTLVTPTADGKYILTSGEEYTVTLEPAQTATVKGYCIVNINGENKKTGVILDDEMVDDVYTTATAPFEFTIVTEKDNTVVTFESHWGVLLTPDVVADSTITVKESLIEITNDSVTE